MIILKTFCFKIRFQGVQMKKTFILASGKSTYIQQSARKYMENYFMKMVN